MITLHEISDLTTYKNALYDAIKRIEEKQVELAPYVDPKLRPAIGIGFDLRDANVRQAVFATLGVVESNYQQQLTNAINATYSTGDNSSLQTALNTIMANRAADPTITNGRTTFTFNNETEVRTTFDSIIQTYENRLNSKMGGSIVANSFERIALVSLVYQSTNNITNEFIRAYQAGDRAETWYQLRYNTALITIPGNEGIRNGLAKRNFYSAGYFGLYDGTGPSSLTDEEAKSFFRVYTRHSADIQRYQNLLSVSEDTIVSWANRDYQTTFVENLQTQMTLARDYLVSRFGQGIIVDWQNIYVGEDQSTLYYRTTDTDLLTGSSQSDLIFGESGNDTLQGNLGDDVLYGGTGVDIYKYRPNDGNDVIVDNTGGPNTGDGKGLILYDPNGVAQGLSVGLRKPTDPAGEWKSPDGSVSYRWSGTPGDDLTIQTPTGTLTVKNYYAGNGIGRSML